MEQTEQFAIEHKQLPADRVFLLASSEEDEREDRDEDQAWKNHFVFSLLEYPSRQNRSHFFNLRTTSLSGDFQILPIWFPLSASRFEFNFDLFAMQKMGSWQVSANRQTRIHNLFRVGRCEAIFKWRQIAVQFTIEEEKSSVYKKLQSQSVFITMKQILKLLHIYSPSTYETETISVY